MKRTISWVVSCAQCNRLETNPWCRTRGPSPSLSCSAVRITPLHTYPAIYLFTADGLRYCHPDSGPDGCVTCTSLRKDARFLVSGANACGAGGLANVVDVSDFLRHCQCLPSEGTFCAPTSSTGPHGSPSSPQHSPSLRRLSLCRASFRVLTAT